MATLRRAAEAGLVHTVSNSQEGVWYICNCCTCSCGILRGMADLGMANVVARSAFVNQVDEDACRRAALLRAACQFGAMHGGQRRGRGRRALHRLRRLRAGLPRRGALAGATA